MEKAQTVFEHACGGHWDIRLRAAADIAYNRGWLASCRVAIDHAVLARSCTSNAVILARDEDASAYMKGPCEKLIVENDQAGFAKFCEVKVVSAWFAITSRRGSCQKASVENAQAMFPNSCGLNCPMFGIEDEAIAVKSGASSKRR